MSSLKIGSAILDEKQLKRIIIIS